MRSFNNDVRIFSAFLTPFPRMHTSYTYNIACHPNPRFVRHYWMTLMSLSDSSKFLIRKMFPDFWEWNSTWQFTDERNFKAKFLLFSRTIKGKLISNCKTHKCCKTSKHCSSNSGEQLVETFSPFFTYLGNLSGK